MDIHHITIGPAAGHPHTHTVVFLHGRGDNVTNFASGLGGWRNSSGRTLADVFPTFRWVLPQAPLRPCANGGPTWPQWFDVWNTRDFAEREDLQAVGLREVVPALLRLLAAEAAALAAGTGTGTGTGTGWDRVVLAGISMGAATGAHVLFNLGLGGPGTPPLAAFMGFSGRCPFAGRCPTLPMMRQALGLGDGAPVVSDSVLRRTPVLLEHCADDPLVPVWKGHEMSHTLLEFGATIEWREYPTGGHWFNSPAGADDAVWFLKKYVLDREESQTK
ncbi:phospholipase/carboxylesterase family protein [Xylariaceae sp. FL0804]|nr:phospholipase/carboxylesterase family protein [Xylariaceae sp. FL0804]